MTVLIIGLVIFLGVHSLRIVADDWRAAQLARIGEQKWKGWYSLASALGLVLIVWGYGMTRASPIVVWDPPAWTRHATALLTLFAFLLIAAAYVPGNRIKAALGHPMVAGVKLWAFAHLLSNGRLGDVLLFGTFLVWAALDFVSARKRDRAAGTRYPAGTTAGDVKTIIGGVIVYVLFAFFLHKWLIGVAPFG
jgi:uncharacterized membrane protein